MLKIRLSRTGKKNQPSFKVVVQEHTAPIKGKFLEELGFYRPAEDPKVFKVDMERVKYWMSVGATPSDSLAVLLKNEGLEGMDKFIAPRDKQRKKKKVEEKAEAPAAEGAPAAEQAPAQAEAEQAPAEEKSEEKAEEKPVEEAPAEAPKAEEKPAEEPSKEPEAEPKKEETKPE